MSGRSYNAKYLLPLNSDADRKSLEILVGRLFKKGPEDLTCPQQSPANCDFSKYSRNKYKKLLKPYNPKGWLKKDSSKSNKMNPSGERETNCETICSRKYDIKLPTIQESLVAMTKFNNDVQLVNNLLNKIEPLEERISVNVDIVNAMGNEKNLDCKHLSNLELKDFCKRNLCYISEIRSGTRFSKRHTQFVTNRQKNFIYRDLTYNTSMITFTYEQKQQMLRFLTDNFCKGIYDSKTDVYFFKVLLPELCLKVFMDVHNMNQEQACRYLEKRPIQ